MLTKVYAGNGRWLVTYRGMRALLNFEPTPQFTAALRATVDKKRTRTKAKIVFDNGSEVHLRKRS